MDSVLFVNAKVWQPGGRFDEAFGFKNGTFSFTGTVKESGSYSPEYDKVIDLNGRVVLPGLIDGHIHLVKGALIQSKLDCGSICSTEELKNAVTEYSEKNQTDWIIGSNLDVRKVFPDPGNSSVNIADLICTKKPLFITNFDFHSAVCNSAAFEKSGLCSRLDDYSDAEITRLKNGSPGGIIKEKTLKYLYTVIPEPTLEEKVNAASEFIKVLNSYGITSVSDITLPEDIDVYIELYKQGKLNVRINSYIPFEELENLDLYIIKTLGINHDFFTINGFKEYWDGALGSQTALFSKHYKGMNNPGYKTNAVTSGSIHKIAAKLDAAGKQMIIHAIGDKAVSEVLDLYESLPNTKKLRHRIEHAQHIQPADFSRFINLEVIASVQPVHLKYDAETVKNYLPDELTSLTHNYLHIIKNGGVVNFGTDFPIVPVDPFENIRIAATRKTASGTFLPELRIPLNECIKAYTINNAYSNKNDNAVGSITRGKSADFVILDTDIFSVKPSEISGVKVLKTYLNGGEVYSV